MSGESLAKAVNGDELLSIHHQAMTVQRGNVPVY